LHSKYVRGSAFFCEPVVPMNSTSTKQNVIFGPLRHLRAGFGVAAHDLELRDRRLVPVVVLRSG
jgi:hypothetical protein